MRGAPSPSAIRVRDDRETASNVMSSARSRNPFLACGSNPMRELARGEAFHCHFPGALGLEPVRHLPMLGVYSSTQFEIDPLSGRRCGDERKEYR